MNAGNDAYGHADGATVTVWNAHCRKYGKARVKILKAGWRCDTNVMGKQTNGALGVCKNRIKRHMRKAAKARCGV